MIIVDIDNDILNCYLSCIYWLNFLDETWLEFFYFPV